MNSDGEEKIGTKELILLEALRLFAQKGYSAVRVAEIAQAVHVSAPALYKHYKSKQEIFEAIVEKSEREYMEKLNHLNVKFKTHPENQLEYIDISEDRQVEMMLELCDHLLHDEFHALFRKLMIVEQYNIKKLSELFDERYVKNAITSHASLFKLLMDAGKMQESDPEVLALQYISPVLMLLGLCDREPDKEEWAMKKLEEHIRLFNRKNRI